MPIKVLAPDLISRIAAGEVIERPSSVVKELVENSLDAGATEIGIEALGGGVELIKVSDNGAGIPSSEIELAFHRYATSKISSLTDLERISSLGFRGEALPSIAAVAEVEVSSKAPSDAVGTCICLKKGNMVRKESYARSQGTAVTVRQLFRYFPARLKFLKSASRENSHIAHTVSQYALAFPEVKFSLFLDKHLSLQTTGSGNLRDVVDRIYGLELAQRMLEVNGRDALSQVSGLVSPPSLTRSSRNYLSFFVNRRWVRSPLLVRAAEQAYHGLLMTDKHPVAIINVRLPSEEIDVNVHPTKAEVKFHHEQAVFASVEEAIDRTLSKTSLATTKAVPFATTPHRETALLHPPEQWMVHDNEPAFTAPLPTPGLPVLRVMGQLANTYIIAEGPDGLYLIDQHAAHERILYERILAQWSQSKVEIQGLLQPVTIELSPGEEETWDINREALAQFGFTIESFGDRSYLVRAVPALMTETDVAEVISTVLDNLGEKEDSSLWQEKVAQSLACHSAIKAGQQLSNEEMRELVKQLEAADQPRTCPHGRPVMIHLSSRQLEKEFDRIP